MTMSSATFSRQLNVEASTRRPPAMVGGKRGDAVEHLPLVHVAPLTPVSIETAQRVGLDSPYNLLQTFTDGDVDIADGDELTPQSGRYAGRAMAVKRVVRLSWGVMGRIERLHILLENLRR
jgi:hypothetical protein